MPPPPPCPSSTARDGKAERKSQTKLRHRLALPMRSLLFVAVLMSTVAVAMAVVRAQSSWPPEATVEATALKWFEEMRTGQIDRAQLTAEYSAQLTDDAVRKMSAYLSEYKYGASPRGAQIIRTRTIGNQAFYDVKLIFPRGDAASLLLGFNREGKITGISLMSMAGD